MSIDLSRGEESERIALHCTVGPADTWGWPGGVRDGSWTVSRTVGFHFGIRKGTPLARSGRVASRAPAVRFVSGSLAHGACASGFACQNGTRTFSDACISSFLFPQELLLLGCLPTGIEYLSCLQTSFLLGAEAESYVNSE